MEGERKFYLTKGGLEKIKKEYEIIKNIRLAKNNGEAPKIWESEDVNPEYIAFQEDLNFIEKRLAELENILKNVILIQTAKGKDKNKIVEVGARVQVEIDNNEEDELTIVGTLEASPSLGKISNESPVGKALLGHREGDKVVVSSPIKTIYKIKRIEYL